LISLKELRQLLPALRAESQMHDSKWEIHDWESELIAREIKFDNSKNENKETLQNLSIFHTDRSCFRKGVKRM